jgi:DNA-binding MarR family transcriptional regulator
MDAHADYRKLVRLIRRLARALDIQSRRIDRETGLTLPQLMVLTALGEMGEVTSRALSAEADMSPPTVVGVLDKLAGKGLIERYRSERDRRIVHARLTAAGRAALAVAPDPLGEELAARIRALTAEERRALGAALALLGDGLDTAQGAADLPGVG